MAVRAAWLAICSLFHLCACIGKQPACTLPVQKSWAVHEGTEPYCTQSCQVGESGPKVFSAISSSWLSTDLVWELLTTQDVHSWMDACLPFCLSSCSLRNHCLCFILFFSPVSCDAISTTEESEEFVGNKPSLIHSLMLLSLLSLSFGLSITADVLIWKVTYVAIKWWKCTNPVLFQCGEKITTPTFIELITTYLSIYLFIFLRKVRLMFRFPLQLSSNLHHFMCDGHYFSVFIFWFKGN